MRMDLFASTSQAGSTMSSPTENYHATIFHNHADYRVSIRMPDPSLAESCLIASY